MSVKTLKAKERFSRLYCIYLALSNSYLVKELCTKKRKKAANEVATSMLSNSFLRGYYCVIEATLLFHLWLKKEQYLKSDFTVNDENVDSRAVNRVKHYLEMFKNKIHRGGNNLKTPKFHQMLHVCDYIQRHGCPMNYDGSRGENFGKLKIKDNAKLTNKQKGTLNFDIGRRISEEHVIDQVSNVYYNNKGYWPSDYCNDTDITENGNRNQSKQPSNMSSNVNVIANRHFKLICTIDSNKELDSIPEDINVHINWGGHSKTPLANYPSEILKKFAYRLFICSPNIGGKIDPDSVIHGYTEIKLDGNIIYSHPRYSNIGCWYDWDFFR